MRQVIAVILLAYFVLEVVPTKHSKLTSKSSLSDIEEALGKKVGQTIGNDDKSSIQQLQQIQNIPDDADDLIKVFGHYLTDDENFEKNNLTLEDIFEEVKSFIEEFVDDDQSGETTDEDVRDFVEEMGIICSIYYDARDDFHKNQYSLDYFPEDQQDFIKGIGKICSLLKDGKVPDSDTGDMTTANPAPEYTVEEIRDFLLELSGICKIFDLIKEKFQSNLLILQNISEETVNIIDEIGGICNILKDHNDGAQNITEVVEDIIGEITNNPNIFKNDSLEDITKDLWDLLHTLNTTLTDLTDSVTSSTDSNAAQTDSVTSMTSENVPTESAQGTTGINENPTPNSNVDSTVQPSSGAGLTDGVTSSSSPNGAQTEADKSTNSDQSLTSVTKEPEQVTESGPTESAQATTSNSNIDSTAQPSSGEGLTDGVTSSTGSNGAQTPNVSENVPENRSTESAQATTGTIGNTGSNENTGSTVEPAGSGNDNGTNPGGNLPPFGNLNSWEKLLVIIIKHILKSEGYPGTHFGNYSNNVSDEYADWTKYHDLSDIREKLSTFFKKQAFQDWLNKHKNQFADNSNGRDWLKFYVALVNLKNKSGSGLKEAISNASKKKEFYSWLEHHIVQAKQNYGKPSNALNPFSWNLFWKNWLQPTKHVQPLEEAWNKNLFGNKVIGSDEKFEWIHDEQAMSKEDAGKLFYRIRLLRKMLTNQITEEHNIKFNIKYYIEELKKEFSAILRFPHEGILDIKSCSIILDNFKFSNVDSCDVSCPIGFLEEKRDILNEITQELSSEMSCCKTKLLPLDVKRCEQEILRITKVKVIQMEASMKKFLSVDRIKRLECSRSTINNFEADVNNAIGEFHICLEMKNLVPRKACDK